jgi:hypothetical protein
VKWQAKRGALAKRRPTPSFKASFHFLQDVSTFSRERGRKSQGGRELSWVECA